MYKCTKCNAIHSQEEWNKKVDDGVEIQECDNENAKYFGAEYLFDCPSCEESGCFEDKDIIKVE
jgi:hypothetical protein